MTELTRVIALLLTLFAVTSGAAVSFGADGVADSRTDALDAQETTTQAANQATETTQANQTDETTQDDGVREPDRQETTTQDEGTTRTNETTQTNTTAQQTAEPAQMGSETNVTLRNVTIETLVLRNVTVTDARFGTLTVANASAENATGQTYGNVTVAEVQTTANASDLTLTNVSIRSESLAETLVAETGRQRIDSRLVMDRAVLSNETVSGLVVENATVSADAVENVSVPAGDSNGTTAGAAADDRAELVADSAVLEAADVTALDVSGLSVGETTQAATGDETTGNQTTTASE